MHIILPNYQKDNWFVEPSSEPKSDAYYSAKLSVGFNLSQTSLCILSLKDL